MMPRNVIDGNQLVELLQDEEGLRVSRTTWGPDYRFAIRIEYGLGDYVEVSYFGGQTFTVRAKSAHSVFNWVESYTVDQILDIIL